MGSEEPEAATTPADALRWLAVIGLILVLGYVVAACEVIRLVARERALAGSEPALPRPQAASGR